jgi:hypothetical protein
MRYIVLLYLTLSLLLVSTIMTQWQQREESERMAKEESMLAEKGTVFAANAVVSLNSY